MTERKPIFRDEKELAMFLVEELKKAGEYRDVEVNVSLASFKPDEYWSRWYDEQSRAPARNRPADGYADI